MPLPASWKTVTVTATFTRADTAGPAAGSVQFTPVKAVGIAADVVLPALITATLNGSGQISVSLPCPNSAGVTSLVYEVIERVPGGRSYYIEVLASMTGSIALADLDPLTDDQAAYYSLRGPTGDVTPSALAAQAAAEAAADAAAVSAGAAAASIASGNIYASTAAGLAATASGGYFSVPSADSAEYLILYKNNAGSAVEVKRYPSAAAVLTLQQFQSDLDGYAVSIQPTKNLYNPAEKVVGQYVNSSSGAIQSASGWARTGPIPVTPGQQYTISVNGTKQNGLAFYSGLPATGTYIAGSVNSTVLTAGQSMTVTAPAGAVYMCMSVQGSSIPEPSQIQVEQGAAATAFEAWHLPRRVVNAGAIVGEVSTPALTARVVETEGALLALNDHAAYGGSMFPLPSKLRNLKAWYQISDLSTLFQDSTGFVPVTAAGQPVGLILDKSGNGKHFAQPNNSLRPLLKQDARGFYYLEGDKTNKWLSVSGSKTYFKFLHDGTGGTVGISAALEDVYAGDYGRYLLHSNGVSTGAAGFGVGIATGFTPLVGNTMTRIGTGAASVISSNSPNGSFRVDGGGMTVITSYKSQAGTDYRQWIDGAQPGAGLGESNPPTGSDSLNDLTLFSSSAGAYFSGKFYGAALFSGVLSEFERINLTRYLMSLYGAQSFVLGVGDSHTYNTSYGQTIRDFYPARLESALRSAGLAFDSVNKGVSGDTTANIIARLRDVLEPGGGRFAVIYAGTNDLNAASTVQASPAPTSTTFAVAAGKGVYHAAGGRIKVNGVPAVVLSVVGDTITIAEPLASAPAAGQAVTIDVMANIVAIGNALMGAGYPRIIVGGQHYLNFASGGDTLAVPAPNLVALRALQQAAAAQLGALYVDFHSYMRALIVAGTFAQGDDTAWHVAAGNTHLNNVGEQILADAIYQSMQAAGWA